MEKGFWYGIKFLTTPAGKNERKFSLIIGLMELERLS
jgi:hypothetical protein